MDALPPDPYAALGVSKDATAAAIKAQYRKLVLKHHPDKVQDEAQKAVAADEFHKVQTAYEILIDDDRRQRYDSQCRLAELRNDRDAGYGRSFGVTRTSSYRGGDWYTGNVSPHYEERRPSYAEYFESPRPTSRKEDGHDKSSRRTPARDSHKKSKTKTSERKTKDNERSTREEKVKRTDQDMRREREKKFAHATVEEDYSNDSDEFERRRFERDDRMHSDPESRRGRAAMDESRRRQDEEATANFFGPERSQKYYSQDFEARAYIARGGLDTTREPIVMERRPSPVRKSSSRDHTEAIKRDGKPTINIRRGSGRPTPASRDSGRDSGRKSSSREKDIEIVDSPIDEAPRRIPALNKTYSSPENIRPAYERRRSNSEDDAREPPPHPAMKRAETMPYLPNSTDSRRKDSSKLRNEPRHSYPTPDTTPEPPSIKKFGYSSPYVEEPTPISADAYPSAAYQTIYREPTGSKPRLTRSPSPIRESRRGSASARYVSPPAAQPPPPTKRTTSHTYAFPNGIDTTESFTRPAPTRENSGRLFGEIPTNTRSPRPSTNTKMYSLPAEDVRYTSKPRAEDVKASSGYKIRRSNEKPYHRNGQPISVR